LIQAAGILFIANGTVLLVRRSDTGDHAGEWSLPGGKIEEGETPEDAAVRECQEELGTCPEGAKDLFARRNDGKVDYFTFIQRLDKPFRPILNDEHDGFQWTPIGEWPKDLHPGAKVALDKLTMNELEIARSMVKGDLTSPQYYMNLALFDIRITGTGSAYRQSLNEYVYRDPKYYLTNDFLARCNGLPVILEHPDSTTLDSTEFTDRVIGTVLLPYIKENEVWAIVKIYDKFAAGIMETEKLSTSPSVVFRDKTKNRTIKLEDGSKLLIEGDPSLLDHIAICPKGVWDKTGEPSGVNSTAVDDSNQGSEKEPNSTKEIKMADDMPAEMMDSKKDAKKDAAGTATPDPKLSHEFETEGKTKADGEADTNELLKKIMGMCDSMNARMDSMEQKYLSGMKKDSDEPTVTPQASEATEKKNLEDIPKPKEGSPSAEMAAGISKPDADEMAKMKERLDSLDKKFGDAMAEPTMDEQAKYMDAQARADSVAQAFGDSAPRPMKGESLLTYRKRLLKKYQTHSNTWKSVDLGPMSGDVLAIAEPQIYNDAMIAAKNPTDLPEDTLREVITTDRTGRRVSNFHGKPRAWMGQFRAPSRRVSEFGTNQRSA